MAIIYNPKLHRFIDTTTGRVVSKDPFQRILAKSQHAEMSQKSEKEARQWFRSEAAKTKRQTVTKTITKPLKEGGLDPDLQSHLTDRMMFGQMYMFYYDPKWKRDDRVLPYYDVHPLIFPIDYAKDGFLGINFHYLPRKYRAVLMDALYNNVTTDKSGQRRLEISYGILNSAAKFKYFKPTVKHYLNKQMRSPFLTIPYDRWDIALFLPSEQFEKAATSRVWDDSVRKIHGL